MPKKKRSKREADSAVMQATLQALQAEKARLADRYQERITVMQRAIRRLDRAEREDPSTTPPPPPRKAGRRTSRRKGAAKSPRRH